VSVAEAVDVTVSGPIVLALDEAEAEILAQFVLMGAAALAHAPIRNAVTSMGTERDAIQATARARGILSTIEERRAARRPKPRARRRR